MKSFLLYFNVLKNFTMLYVGESAKKRIEEIITKKELPKDYFVRVSVTSGGCSGLTYKMDFDNEKKPNDQIFEDNGVTLVTDLKSFLYLCNTSLEFSGGLEGKGFYFENPNASRTCGCGESFAV
jgi:iron-sulfur cluster assembly protein